MAQRTCILAGHDSGVSQYLSGACLVDISHGVQAKALIGEPILMVFEAVLMRPESDSRVILGAFLYL